MGQWDGSPVIQMRGWRGIKEKGDVTWEKEKGDTA